VSDRVVTGFGRILTNSATGIPLAGMLAIFYDLAPEIPYFGYEPIARFA
jgi:hypothetical protein